MRRQSSASYHRDLQWFAAISEYEYGTVTFEAVPCAYCGLPADTEDHVTPLAFYHAGLEVVDMSEMRLALVPACRECNLIAGSHVFPTVLQKRRYIQERLRCRYKKLLEIPEWSEDDLDELSLSLARYVRRSLRLREIIWRRITYRAQPVRVVEKPLSSSGLGNGSARNPAAIVSMHSASLPDSAHSIENE